MENLVYTVLLADGTAIKNLTKNGDNFISKEELTKDMFVGNCSTVTIRSEEGEEVLENMEIVQVTKMGDEYWFVLRQLSDMEIQMATMSSNIDFLAMMNDVEL